LSFCVCVVSDVKEFGNQVDRFLRIFCEIKQCIEIRKPEKPIQVAIHAAMSIADVPTN
jgi:hypothetical protein